MANFCLSFDGSDDYVSAGTTDLPTGNSNRTLGGWIKLNNYPSWDESFFFGYGNFVATNAYLLYINNSYKRLSFSSWANSINGATILNLGQWYYVVVTNESNSVKLYLNGAQDGSGTSNINTSSGSTFYFGRIAGSLGNIRKLDGFIDDVRIYNRALSADEIQALYSSSVGKYK